MKCKKCGLCCKWIQVGTMPKHGEVDWDFIKARNVIAVDHGAIVVFYVNAPCPHLTEDNLCNIQDSKPKSCIDFPTNEIEALPNCGWWDEDEEDSNSTDIQ